MGTKFESIEALKNKKKELLDNQKERAEFYEVRVAMATCAIATGANEVYEAIEKMIRSEGILNIHLKATGCMGYCYAEPTVEIVQPSGKKVMYGNVDTQLALDILEKHIKNGQMLNEYIVDVCHKNA